MAVTLKRLPDPVFGGMIHPLDRTFGVPLHHVQPVRTADIPEALRDYARPLLAGHPSGEWYALGEFRYAHDDYETALACRIMRNGVSWFVFGIEV